MLLAATEKAYIKTRQPVNLNQYISIIAIAMAAKN